MKMRSFRFCCLAFASFFAATANASSYDCQVEVPKSLYRSGNAAELKPINSPEFWAGKLSLKIKIKKGKADELDVATVDWPSDPINVAGMFPVVHVAKGVLAFGAYSSGPCLFTETECLSQIQIADRANGEAILLILPTALWTDRETDTRTPFVVAIEGTCKKIKS
jgi:hypothetical protein